MAGRCLCVLLAYVMFIEPVGLYQTSQAAIDYSNLSRANWGIVDTDIHYRYDDNGSQTEKIVADKDEPDPDNNFIEKTRYTYNLRNRLAKVEFTTDGTNWDVTAYKYDDEGIRIEKNDNGTVTKYIVDSHNHTGYAQVLEEWTDGVLTKTYIIGDDVIGEADSSGTVKYLLYDGQGSVRHHADDSGDLMTYGAQSCDTFAYDAYGCRVDPLKDSVNQGLFYTGQQWDPDVSGYYLRARYYDPLVGRFNQLDPFSGSPQDPQSLHKYLYCHANPINATDPSGMFFGGLSDTLCTYFNIAILYALEYSPKVFAFTWALTKLTAALWFTTIAYMILQDIGVVPQDEYVAEIATILGQVLILELFVLMMLPVSWRSPAVTQTVKGPRGMNDPKVRKAVEIGNRVHYDKTTDPFKYRHEGGPTQLQNKFRETTFEFAKRGQGGVDVKVIGGKHPSVYPESTWPSGMGQADFKPNTPTGNAMKVPANTFRIRYEPDTGQLDM